MQIVEGNQSGIEIQIGLFDAIVDMLLLKTRIPFRYCHNLPCIISTVFNK